MLRNSATPQAGPRAFPTALFFFAVALAGAGQEKPLAWQLTRAAGAQVPVGYWSAPRSDDTTPTTPAESPTPYMSSGNAVLGSGEAKLLLGTPSGGRRPRGEHLSHGQVAIEGIGLE